MDEVFHHAHHAINRNMRKSNKKIPDMPEERNPIFLVYPVCMGISLLLLIGWLCTKVLNRKPIIALMGNGIGGILIMIGGISAMRHAEKHINLNEVSDEELLTHPIFIHNFVMCIISIFGMILYFVPAWILLDVYKWQRKNGASFPKKKAEKSHTDINNYRCTCSRSKSRSPRSGPSPRSQRYSSGIYDMTQISISPSPSTRASATQGVDDGPIILYCCCVDCHRYVKAARRADNFTHEFQVVQVM